MRKTKISTSQLDDLCRKIVRKMSAGQCERCGQWKEGHVHHVYTKASHPHIRWEIENLLYLCPDCHGDAHRHPRAMIEWFERYHPDRYAWLHLPVDNGYGKKVPYLELTDKIDREKLLKDLKFLLGKE